MRSDAGSLKTQRLKAIRKRMNLDIRSGISKDNILDWIELNMGLTRKRAEEYIELILRAEGWVETEGKIINNVDQIAL